MAGTKSDNKRERQKNLAKLMSTSGITRPANNGLSGFPVMEAGSAAYRRAQASTGRKR